MSSRSFPLIEEILGDPNPAVVCRFATPDDRSAWYVVAVTEVGSGIRCIGVCEHDAGLAFGTFDDKDLLRAGAERDVRFSPTSLRELMTPQWAQSATVCRAERLGAG